MNLSPSSQAFLNAIEKPYVADQETSNTAEKAKQRLSDDEVSKLMFVINHETVARLDKIKASALISKLKTIIDQVGKNVDEQYPEHRISYCAIQLQLNKRFAVKEVGVPSPAFRPRFKYGRKPKGALELLSNDTQVIDMHFMHCNKIRTVTGAYAVKAFGEHLFSFDDAYRFALTAGKKSLKLQLLGLQNRDTRQFPLVWLKTKKQYDAVERIKRSEKLFAGNLESIACNVPRVSGNEKVWATLLSADKACAWLKLEPTPQNLLLVLRLCNGMPHYRADKLKTKLNSARKYYNM